MNSIDCNVKMLCSAQKSLSDINQKIYELEQAIRMEHSELYELKNRLSKEAKEFEDIVREEAFNIYQEREDKADKEIIKGVTIKIFKKLDYTYDNAFKWARKNNTCLSLDESAFESICKGKLRPDFVEELETPKVFISKDLSVFYDEGLI